jgi:hypothetical protein
MSGFERTDNQLFECAVEWMNTEEAEKRCEIVNSVMDRSPSKTPAVFAIQSASSFKSLG